MKQGKNDWLKGTGNGDGKGGLKKNLLLGFCRWQMVSISLIYWWWWVVLVNPALNTMYYFSSSFTSITVSSGPETGFQKWKGVGGGGKKTNVRPKKEVKSKIKTKQIKNKFTFYRWGGAILVKEKKNEHSSPTFFFLRFLFGSFH